MEWKWYGMCEINGNAQVAIPQTETNYAHIDIIDDCMTYANIKSSIISI